MVRFLSNLTFFTLEFTWSDTNEHFLDKVSPQYEDPVVYELLSLITEGLQIWGTFVLEGIYLMEFLGKNSTNNLRLPEYLEPQPSAGLFPDKRSLACKALLREGLM